MKKKRNLAPVVALGALALTLAACGGPTQSSETSRPDQTSSGIVTPPVTNAPVASGAFQYVDRSYEQRTEILGKLEKYAIDNTLAGLPLYENSGYQMFNPRIVKGVENYVKNYGFSTIRDGYIKEGHGITGETDTRYQNYYHDYSATDPQTLNRWNAQDNVVSDFAGQTSTSYFGNRLNAEKNGYEWYGILSTDDRMLAVENGNVKPNCTSGELHTTWRMHVRTGEEGRVKYRTNSKIDSRKAFDQRYVTLEDYLTTYKMMLNGANNLYRGTELAKKTGKGALVGCSNYYNATKALGVKGVNTSPEAEKAFEKVGVKGGTDAQGDYIEFTFATPVNRFFAMYTTNGDLYQPLPKEFIDLVGIDALNGYSSDRSTTPVDNTLSVGPYFIESWETDQLVTYKRDDTWFERVDNPNLYRIGGIHTKIIKALNSDENAAFREFEAGHLDSCGIPRDHLEKYASDPRSVQVPGSSVWKLNINSCTPETWEKLFGEKGTVHQTPRNEYWKVKPWMSNDNFIRGIFYSIDRNTMAKEKGARPSIDYFSGAYLSNPEEGVSYNDTQAHKDALVDFWGDTVATAGYNKALAQEAFKQAIIELKQAGHITDTTPSIEIEIWWLFESQIREEGKQLSGYLSSAFDAAADSLGLPVRLNVKNSVPADPGQTYEEHLQIGHFDLGFGAISGNVLDPLNFLEVLKSDNSSGFTLNWGPDTSEVTLGSNALEFDGKTWSFDGLWGAADSGIVLDKEGQQIQAGSVQISSAVKEGANIKVTGKTGILTSDGLKVDPVCICGTTSGEFTDYFEVYAGENQAVCQLGDGQILASSWAADGTFSITFGGKLAENIANAGGIPLFALDYSQEIGGVYCGIQSAIAQVPLQA